MFSILAPPFDKHKLTGEDKHQLSKLKTKWNKYLKGYYTNINRFGNTGLVLFSNPKYNRKHSIALNNNIVREFDVRDFFDIVGYFRE